VKSILEKGLEQMELPLVIPEPASPVHENIRGPQYYQQTTTSKTMLH
jgi:hypothetical protein